jgi:parvulin-like peptidyl-prolyl isomerase
MRFLALVLLLASCGSHQAGGMTGPTLFKKDQRAQRLPIETGDILERERKTTKAVVKHILLGYRGRGSAYNGDMDPRAQGRSRQATEALVTELKTKIDGGTVFEALMIDHSEDPGSAKTGSPYEVRPESALNPDFIHISLRLEVGEVGITHSAFGFHIVKRIN